MVSKLKPQSEFARNVLTLMTGATIAQAIPVIVSPILTRIYSPSDFGLLSLFVAFSAIFSSIASGRYEMAIMLPKKNEEAINILALGAAITVLMTALVAIIVIVFKNQIVLLFKNEEIGFWLNFAPITIFFMSAFNLLSYYNNRCRNYADIKNALIAKSTVMVIVQLTVGWFYQGVAGLISGQIMAQLASNFRLLKNILEDKLLMSKINTLKMIALARKYRNFPKYSMWAGLANVLSGQLPNMIISLIFSVKTLGFYSLVERVLAIPTTLIGNSIGQVFFRVAAEEKQKTGASRDAFFKTTTRLIFIGVPEFSVLYFFVEDIFTFVFGMQWQVAGEYAKIVLPLFCVQFVVSPLTMMNQVNLKNKLDMYWQFGLVSLYVGIFLCAHVFDLNFKQTLHVVVVIISGYYLFMFYLISSYVKES